MRPFVYQQARTLPAALEAGAPAPDGPASFLAGGTMLVDLMKLDVIRPAKVVDINALAAGPMGRIEVNDRGLRLGGLVRMADAADHPAVRRGYPVIAQSLALAASPQLRNMATLAGNVLQRTRCPYFRRAPAAPRSMDITACMPCSARAGTASRPIPAILPKR